MDALTAALEYEKLGLSVIPIRAGEKVAQIDWKEFQTRRATREEIAKWWIKWPKANVGIVTGAISDLCVVDLDRYKENFTIENELLHFPETFSTPTSITPRGGSHLWLKNVAGISGTVDLYPGIDFRGEGNYCVAPPSVNGNGKPYEWVEGAQLWASPAQLCPDSFLALLRDRYNNIYNNKYTIYKGTVTNPKNNETDGDKIRQTVTNGDIYYRDGRRDEDLFHLAYTLIKAKNDLGFVWQTLRNQALMCNPPFPKNEVDIKIKSALDRVDRKEGKLAEEVRDFVMVTNGVFVVTEIIKNLNLVTFSDKKNVHQILSRLRKEGLIEHYGNKNGSYRLVDTDSPVIDIMSADLTPLDIKLPLGVSELVAIHRSNTIVLAGESNAGKTAFCLNVADENKDTFKVNYLSSEMADGTELRIRLNEFQKPIDHWKNIDFRFRVDNFPDVIQPDGINIIDYLDEGTSGEDATHMTKRIRQISHKLKNGVALVCIQKNSQKTFGFGGEGTKNAARLYMTITGQNKLTIEKGKIWKSKNLNPNGAYIEFSLAAGCMFRKKSKWTFKD